MRLSESTVDKIIAGLLIVCGLVFTAFLLWVWGASEGVWLG
jgi:hypothetical protein